MIAPPTHVSEKPSDLSPLAPQVVAEHLAMTSGLCNVTPEQLARAMAHAEQRRYMPGEPLFEPEDSADRLFVILEGCVDVRISGRRFTRRAHDMVGASAVVGHARYGASAIAINTVIALVIRQADIAVLVSHDDTLRSWAYETLLGISPPETALGTGRSRRPAVGSVELLGWLLTILAPALIVIFGPGTGSKLSTTLFLAIAAATVLMWLFNLADEFIPALFAIVAILALDIAPPSVVLSGFTSDGFFMAMGVLALGVLIVASGLSYRVLLLLLKHLPNSQPWHNFSLLLIGTLLTPIVPVTNGRVALIKPILLDMVKTLHLGPQGKAATLLASSAFSGVTLLSAVILSSKSSNFVVYGLLPEQVRDQYQWLGWLGASAVNGAFLFIFYTLLSWLLFRNRERPTISSDAIDIQLRVLGRLTRKEWGAIAGTVFFVLGVLTESIHKVKTPWLGMALMFGFLIFELLNKEEFKKRIDWTLLIYLASLVGFGATFSHFGLDRWVADRLGGLGGNLNDKLPQFLMLLSGGMILIRLVLPMSPAIAIAATVLMPIAEAQGVSAWIVGFAILNLGEMWFFPFQSTQYLQMRETSGEPLVFDERRFLLFNAAMNVARIAAIYLSIPYWWLIGLL